MTISFSYSNWSLARRARIRFSLLAVLVIITIICLVMGWMFRPHAYVAKAYLQINYWESGGASDRQYDNFRNTQQSLMSSGFVINNALVSKKIAELACVSNQEDPVKWLQDKLEVTFPENGDIMVVALAGGEASMPEYCQLIDAIIHSYIDEVLWKEETRNSEERETKKRAVRELHLELTGKLNRLETLLAALDPNQSGEAAEVVLLRAKIETLTDVWKELESQMMLEKFEEETRGDRIRILQFATSSRR